MATTNPLTALLSARDEEAKAAAEAANLPWDLLRDTMWYPLTFSRAELREHLEASRAELARLRLLLRPFAIAARLIPPSCRDNEACCPALEVADLRRAAEAVEEEAGGV